MNVDLAGAASVALLAFAAVVLVLLLVGAGMYLLVRLTAGGVEPLAAVQAPIAVRTTAADEGALRAQAAAVAVAVALARKGAAPSSPVRPSPMSPWQIAMRTAGLTRWRSRR